MKITGIIWPREVVDKLAWKHQVTTEEVNEAMAAARRFRFLEPGDVEGEDLPIRRNEPNGSRALSHDLLRSQDHKGSLIISDREMTRKEQRTYANLENSELQEFVFGYVEVPESHEQMAT